MTVIDTDIIPAPSAPLADRQSTEPSIGEILQTAVQSGHTPEGLEKLAAIYEREMSRRARQEFNHALAAFRAECPALVKNRGALNPKRNNEVMYSYIDLSEITKIIDPILLRHGLTYTFDTEVVSEQTVVTCRVKHEGGHEESSKFTCKGSGTPMMNAAQVAASAVTFGRRYSLVLALGLCIDDDDDGRRAAPPNPQPDADPNAPRVQPRGERTQADPNRVTGTDLADLKRKWETRAGKPGTVAEFTEWAAKVLKREADGLDRTSNWTRAELEKCAEVMA